MRYRQTKITRYFKKTPGDNKKLILLIQKLNII